MHIYIYIYIIYYEEMNPFWFSKNTEENQSMNKNIACMHACMHTHAYTQTAPQQLTSSCRKPVGDLCNTSPGCCACSRFHFCGLTSAKQLGDLPLTSKNSPYLRAPSTQEAVQEMLSSYAINAKLPASLTWRSLPRSPENAIVRCPHRHMNLSEPRMQKCTRAQEKLTYKIYKMHYIA